MVALPTLRPSLFVSSVQTATTDVTTLRDEVDTTFVESAVGNSLNGEWVYELDDVPADFGSMATFSITARVFLSATGNDTWTIRAYLRDAAGNALHALPATSTVTTTAATDFTFTPALPATNTKATWDGARIVLDFVNTKSGPSDGNVMRISRAELAGTYDVAAPPTSIAPARVGLSVSTPKDRLGHSYGVEGAKAAENAGTLTVALFEGATERASNQISLTSTAKNHSFLLTDAQAQSIVDYSLLELRLSATSLSGPINAEVSESWIKVPEADATAPVAVTASDSLVSSVSDVASSTNITNLGEDLASVSLTEQASVVVLGVDVSDNFDRPDNLTDLGTDWNSYTLDNALTISANQAAPKSLLHTAAMHKTLTTNDDQWAEVTIATGGGDSMGIILNAPNTIGTNDADTAAYYLFRYSGTEWRILRKSATANSFTSLASLVKAETFPLTFRAERQGTTLRILVGATEVLAVNLTSALTGQNRVGLRNNNSTAMRFDNFRFADNPPLAGTIAKSASGNVTSSITDTAEVASAVTASDSVSTAVSDTAETTVYLTASDAVASGLSESTAVESAGPANDLVAASLTETASLEKSGLFEYVASDTVASGITEQSIAAIVIVASDTTSAGITDTAEPIVASGETAVAASDSITTSITESSAATISVTSSDALSSSLAETTAIETAGPASDLISPSLTESSALEKTGTFEYAASETLSAGVTDQVSLATVISATDTATSSISDLTEPIVVSGVQDVIASETVSTSITDTSTVAIVASSSDSLSAGISDVSTIVSASPGEDIVSASITETASVVADGSVSVSVSDSITTSLGDQSVIESLLSVTDTISAAVTETAVLFVTLSNSDTITPSLAEGAVVLLEYVASDGVTTSITDTASLTTDIVIAASDSLISNITEVANVLVKIKKVRVWNGTAYVLGTLKVWNGTAWIIPRIHVWDGTQWM